MGQLHAEAARLYNEAFELLYEDGCHRALDKANQALALFEQLGDLKGAAESLRLVILANRVEAATRQEKPQKANLLAEEALADFRAAANRRGEATMLLALAEINSDRCGPRRRLKALAWGEEASEVFGELGDREMQATALLEVANIHYKRKEPEELLRAAAMALALAQELDNEKLKALSLHCQALGLVIGPRWLEQLEAAVAKADEAAAIFKALGHRRLEAATLRAVANWYLAAGDPKKALAPAEESFRILQQLPNALFQQSSSLRPLADALVCRSDADSDAERALREAQDARSRFQAAGFHRGEMTALKVQSSVLWAIGRKLCAFEAANDALEIAQGPEDKKHQMDLLLSAASLYLQDEKFEEARKKLTEALSVAKELGQLGQRLRALWQLGHLQLRLGEVQAALATAREAQELSAPGSASAAQALSLRATALSACGDRKEALAAAEVAAEFFSAAGDLKREALLWAFVSELHEESQGDLGVVRAIQAAERCITLRRQAGDAGSEAEALLRAANLHLAAAAEGCESNAEEKAQEARRLYKRCNDRAGEANSLLLICQIHVSSAGRLLLEEGSRGNRAASQSLQQAMTFANEAFSIAKRLGDKDLLAWSDYWRAMALMWNRNFEQALRAAHAAHAAFHDLQAALAGDSASTAAGLEGEAHVLVLLAELHLLCGDSGGEGSADDHYRQAREFVEKALSVAKSGVGSGSVRIEGAAFCLQERLELKLHSKGQVSGATPQLEAPRENVDNLQSFPQAEKASEVQPQVAQPAGLEVSFVQSRLKEMVSEMVTSDEPPELDTPLMESGMDSLTAVTFTATAAKEFKMGLSPSLTFDYPNIRSMAEHLVEESRPTAL
ncbi:unnamed protein product [Polarella glacialis]|uniref:Carrier domain-containing protein n=2 Tax=Polarella glacialis TaxID=89957 RepID=A0A813JD58_POLGL|nr:unnamed protein product [Polarella glacialis]